MSKTRCKTAACSISKVVTCQETEPGVPTRVLALYKFVSPPLPQGILPSLKAELEEACKKKGARGTLLIAPEGINGTICYPFDDSDGKEENLEDPLLSFLQSKFDNALRIRLSKADRIVFARLKIKIKSEIVTLHQKECSPVDQKGIYVKPQEWNQLLTDPDCLVIDTRNTYEIDVGTFRNAVNPQTQHFTEFPEYLEKTLASDGSNHDRKPPKKVAMFCKYRLQDILILAALARSISCLA